MLAAASARSVLLAEHERIRGLLDRVAELARVAGCASAVTAAALLEAVEQLRDFDEGTHRPKGVALGSALCARSAEADDHWKRVTKMREHSDALLSLILSKLKAAAAGNVSAAADVESLLQEHRKVTLEHLQEEDTFLRSSAAAHLTRDDWAAIASSISSAVAHPRRRAKRREI